MIKIAERIGRLGTAASGQCQGAADHQRPWKRAAVFGVLRRLCRVITRYR
jgi:hypothetical protein